MDMHDTDKDGLLTEENFLNFYLQASLTREKTVWENLATHHIRPDLKKYGEAEIEDININLLPRVIMSQTNANYEILFCLLDEEQSISEESWKILNK